MKIPYSVSSISVLLRSIASGMAHALVGAINGVVSPPDLRVLSDRDSMRLHEIVRTRRTSAPTFIR